MKKLSQNTKNLTVAAMLLACALLLPQVFHVFGKAVGTVLLPMHIPVLLCGFICGWKWGGALGFVAPLLSSAITDMPVMFPVGFSMMGELCVYGIVTGVMYKYVIKTKNKTLNIYISLICAMLCGRAVSGIIKWALLLSGGSTFTFGAFISSAFIIAWPGIIIQLVLIPILIHAVEKNK